MIPSTITCVASNRLKWPCSAHSDASIVYATEETGSAITAKANPINSSARVTPRTGEDGTLRAVGAGAVCAISDHLHERRPDFPAHQITQRTEVALKNVSRLVCLAPRFALESSLVRREVWSAASKGACR